MKTPPEQTEFDDETTPTGTSDGVPAPLPDDVPTQPIKIGTVWKEPDFDGVPDITIDQVEVSDADIGNAQSFLDAVRGFLGRDQLEENEPTLRP